MTEPQTLTLTEFLLARIAEDEELVDAVTWRGRLYDGEWQIIDTEDDELVATVSHDHEWSHIARHDPTRVLAECEAKRRIVELGRFSDSAGSAVDFWLEDGKGRTPPQPLGTIVEVFRILALPYTDHPDYRPEWRP